MNQPTEDRIKRLEEEQRQLKEDVRKLKEQQTEPIKITRLEIDSGSMKDDVGVLKIQMQGARADILQIRESQGDLRDRLIEHSEDLKVIKEKQDAHSELLGQLINIGESHTANMATKDDVASIKSDISRLEGIMMQILNRMPKAEGE